VPYGFGASIVANGVLAPFFVITNAVGLPVLESDRISNEYAPLGDVLLAANGLLTAGYTTFGSTKLPV